MNNQLTFIHNLRDALAEVKAKGQSTVSIEALENYLTKVASDASRLQTSAEQSANAAAAREKFDIEQRVWEVMAPLKMAESLEMFKSVMESGASALKAAMITNGGAAIALLAFLGNALARSLGGDTPVSLIPIGQAMIIFFMGTWLAAFAYGLRYITQYLYYSIWKKWACIPHIASTIFGASSFCFFLWGGITAHEAFK